MVTQGQLLRTSLTAIVTIFVLSQFIDRLHFKDRNTRPQALVAGQDHINVVQTIDARELREIALQTVDRWCNVGSTDHFARWKLHVARVANKAVRRPGAAEDALVYFVFIQWIARLQVIEDDLRRHFIVTLLVSSTDPVKEAETLLVRNADKQRL